MEIISFPREIALCDFPDLIRPLLLKFLYVMSVQRTFLAAITAKEFTYGCMFYSTYLTFLFNFYIHNAHP